MPTGPNGIPDPRQRSDTISYPRPLLGGLGKWFGAKAGPMDEYQPVAYQTVHIHNQGKETVHAIVASMNRDTQDGEPVPFLSPPDAVNAGTDRSLAFVRLDGRKYHAYRPAHLSRSTGPTASRFHWGRGL